MKKQSPLLKNYLQRPEIFADAFNQFFYHGMAYISPHALIPLNPNFSSSMDTNIYPFLHDNHGFIQICMTDYNKIYCLTVIRKQSDIHYLIPKKLPDDSYFSPPYGYYHSMPVLNLILYLEAKPWHTALPTCYLPITAPFSMSDDDILEFQTDLAAVMLFIKYSKNKTFLHKLFQENSHFNPLDSDTRNLILSLTGHRNIPWGL